MMHSNSIFSNSTIRVSETIKQRPIETFLIVVLTIVNAFMPHAFDGLLTRSVWIVVPLAFQAAFIANAMLPKESYWRKAYDLLLPISIIAIIGCIDEKFADLNNTVPYITLLGILFVIAITAKNLKNDSMFITNTVSIGWAALRAFLVSLAFWIAIGVIVFSIETVFKTTLSVSLMSIPWTLVFPMMTLTFYDHTPKVESIDSELGNGLLNFVVTIALIFFTIVMYVDIIKIIVTQTLPSGGLAFTCYAYFIVAISCSSLYRIAMVNIFNRFYHWLPTLSIPIIILFWVAVIRRIYDYGFTENRIYMVAAGYLNLVFMFMICFDRQKAYKATIIHAMALFFVLGFIPPLSAKNIAEHFQWTNAVASTDKQDAEEEKHISSYHIFENESEDIDITNYRKIMFVATDCHGDTLDIYNKKGELVMSLSAENTIRSIAHKNGMTYDDMIGMAYRGMAKTSLNYENDTAMIVFRRILFNEYAYEASVDAIFIK